MLKKKKNLASGLLLVTFGEIIHAWGGGGSCGVGGPEPGIPAYSSNFLVPDAIGDSGFSDHILRYQDYPGLRSDPWQCWGTKHQSEDHKSAAYKPSFLLQHQT